MPRNDRAQVVGTAGGLARVRPWDHGDGPWRACGGWRAHGGVFIHARTYVPQAQDLLALRVVPRAAHRIWDGGAEAGVGRVLGEVRRKSELDHDRGSLERRTGDAAKDLGAGLGGRLAGAEVTVTVGVGVGGYAGLLNAVSWWRCTCDGVVGLSPSSPRAM